MNQLSREMNQRDKLEWRRNKVQDLLVKGNNHYEIANILQVSRPTITRDIEYLRQQAKSNIKKYIDEKLPDEYEKCLVGLNSILKEAWNTAANTEDKREKIQALSLAKECYGMKLELLTNATVVDDAIRFVSEKQQHFSSKEIILKSNENIADPNSISDEVEEPTTTKITANTTTNHVF